MRMNAFCFLAKAFFMSVVIMPVMGIIECDYLSGREYVTWLSNLPDKAEYRY